MSSKIFKITLISLLIVSLSSIAMAQRQTGTIKGTITDEDGNPLPGVTVTVSSPAMIGTRTFVTTATGAFRFPAVPPGEYSIKVEMSGFQTIERKGVIVSVGMTVTVDISMKASTIEEEITVTAASPVVDVESSKIAVTMTADLLKNVPIARDLYDIVNSAPGVISEGVTYRRTSSIHGGTVRGNTYAFDGVNMNDPVVMYPLTNINFDVMDEVEIVTAGHPAEVGYTDGGYINVVTKSGGNKFSGGATVYYTNDTFNQNLWAQEQIDAMEITEPAYDKSWFDASLTFGGPIMQDKIWFFANVRMIDQVMRGNFKPYTDPLGVKHENYDWEHHEKMGFFKLTAQVTPSLKFMGMFNYVNRNRPMYEQPGSLRTRVATRVWDNEKDYTGTGVINYIFDQNTFLDIRTSYVHRWFPLPMNPETLGQPRYYDATHGSLFTTARFNEQYLRKRFQVGAYLTRFQDDFLGGNHEFKLGAEFEDAYGDWDWWRQNPLYAYWRNNDIHYYGGITGRIYFYICADKEEGSKIIDKGRRIGAYLQDTVTFGERLTLNLGLRFDRSWGFKPAVTKGQAGGIAYWVGENIVRPYVAGMYPSDYPNGINPWSEMTSEEWNNILVWNSLSPRIGLTLDVFGDGKTALKGSFARYTEYMMLQYFSVLHPFYPRSFRFYWYDYNMNNEVDTSDGFRPHPAYDYRVMDMSRAKEKVDDNTKSPINDELVVGLQHELFKDFSIGVNFIYKSKKNIFEDSAYSLDDQKWFYTYDQAPDWWVPFTTIVPGTDEYQDTEVTFYARANDQPPIYYRAHNVPELKRKYRAVEFIFNKRMSNGWQFSGSIVLSKMWGNIGGTYGASWGWSGAADTPNNFVNREDMRLDFDRPLAIKLMGTVQLPYRVFLSAYYRHFSGSPWARGGYIVPPRSWCTANDAQRDYYWVYFEKPGTRRNRASDILDMRLEKEFAIGDIGRLGIYIDAFNVLGWTNVSIGRDDIYIWYPSAENTSVGSVSYEGNYKQILSVSGSRTIKFSVRFSF